MPLVQVVLENVDIKGSCCDSDHGHVDETEGISCPDLDQGEGRFRLQSCAGLDIKSLVELVSKSQPKYFVRTKTRQYRYALRDTMNNPFHGRVRTSPTQNYIYQKHLNTTATC